MAKRVNEPTYKGFITQPIKRFNETNHAFSRGDRREIPGHQEVSDSSLKKQFSNVTGYTQEDRALFLAARTINFICRRVTLSREVPEILEIGHRPRDASGAQIPPDKLPVSNPAEMSKKVKQVAKWLGADLVGITKLNLDWFYSHWGTHTVERYGVHEEGPPIEVPEEYKWAIVMAVEMGYENLRRSPANCAATDLAYSHMAIVSSSLTEFIRELGYKAIPLGNEMALSIPMAVDAGLGELGRNGLLITEKFGPRVRICKVIASLPLVADKPVDSGAQAFCEKCSRCADTCPGKAVKHAERTDKPWNICNNEGILKWPVDGEKCLDWWAKNVDALLAFSYPPGTFLITAQAKAIGLNPKLFYGTVGVAFPSYRDKFGAKTVEGIMGAGVWNPNIPYPGVKEWYQRYVKRWGAEPDRWGTAGGCATCEIMQKVIEIAGSLDPVKVRDVIAREKFDTMLGPVKFKDQFNLYLAIKMLSSEDEIPKDAKRPLRDFGVHFTLCQALALGRKEGLTIVLDKDSQSCPIALAGLGFVRPEEYLGGKYILAPISVPTFNQINSIGYMILGLQLCNRSL